MTSAFTELGDAFARIHPDADVEFTFAASSLLANQIADGAPGDIFASADEETMSRLVADGHLASAPTVFATNRARIIVEPGNPRGIESLPDLADEDLIVIACTPEAPCGRYARRILDTADITIRFRSLEENSRAVVSKIVLGEADAGIVYETDVVAAGASAMGVAIPDDLNIVARYPIAITHMSRSPSLARAFLDFVTSDAGQAVLARHGFGAP